MSGQIDRSGGVGTGGGANGQPHHQPVGEEAAGPGFPETDQLRAAIRERIFECIGKRQTSAERRKRLLELAKRVVDILYKTFPNKNDYFNMMKGPIEPQLIVCVKTMCAQRQQYQQNLQLARQTPSSSSSNEDENLDVDGLSELFASLQFASTH